MNVVMPAALTPGQPGPGYRYAPMGDFYLAAEMPADLEQGLESFELTLDRLRPGERGVLTMDLDKDIMGGYENRSSFNDAAAEMSQQLADQGYEPWRGWNWNRMVEVYWERQVVVIRVQRSAYGGSRTPSRYSGLVNGLLKQATNVIRRARGIQDDVGRATGRVPRWLQSGDDIDTLNATRQQVKNATRLRGAGVVGGAGILSGITLKSLIIAGALIWFALDTDGMLRWFMEKAAAITKTVIIPTVKAAGKGLGGLLPDAKTMMMYAAAGGIVLVGIMMLTKR